MHERVVRGVEAAGVEDVSRALLKKGQWNLYWILWSVVINWCDFTVTKFEIKAFEIGVGGGEGMGGVKLQQEWGQARLGQIWFFAGHFL